MTITDTQGVVDKGDLAYAALKGIEEMLGDKNLKLGEHSDNAVYDAIWDRLLTSPSSPPERGHNASKTMQRSLRPFVVINPREQRTA